jgi:hypothetical protein
MAKTKYSAHQDRCWMIANIEELYKIIKSQDSAAVIGVDPSSTGLGLFSGVWRPAGVEIIGVSRSGSKTKTSFQNCASHGEVSSEMVCKTLQSDYPTKNNKQNLFIFHEEVTVSNNFTGMKAVAIATGATFAGIANGIERSTCVPIQGGREVTEYVFPLYISQIKKALTGNHKADKTEIHAVLSDKGLEFSDDNQADAYGAFLIGANLLDIVSIIGGEIRKWKKLGMKKEMREFETYVETISGDFPTVSILKNPKLYKNLTTAGLYVKKREAILNL